MLDHTRLPQLIIGLGLLVLHSVKKIPANGTQLKYFHTPQNMELMEGL